jgi:hypothetical protein
MLGTILLVFAFVLTMIAAVTQPQPIGGWASFPNLGWLGISLWILSILLGGMGVR